MPKDRHIAIIGAGIIGLSSADYLQRAGRDVTLIDRKGIANEASSGNAGALAFADVLPLASKGMILKAPGWILDPLGPLSIRPSYLPTVLPWLYRFWRASKRENYHRSLTAQSDLMRLAEQELEVMCAATSLDERVRHDGALHLYESRRAFRAALPGWKLREQFGVSVEHLQGNAVGDYQPGLSKRVVAATFIPKWKTVDDPRQVAVDIADRVVENGGRILRQQVIDINPAPDGVEIGFVNGDTLFADKVVIAAGAWSHKLTGQLGDDIPLETERGYNTTLPTDAFDLKRQLIFGDRGFVVTPLSSGIRIGGAVEFAGLDAAPNFKRSRAMLKRAKRLMPELNIDGGKPWMGFRPSIPDSLPVIGPSSKTNDILYAFGHGHLGLTQAFATARLVTDMISGKTSSIDVSPFRADRF